MMRVTIEQLPSISGRSIQTTDPIAITQQDIDAFASATGDDQWIHVDPARAAEGPFGMTIVHGYLMLSLLGGFWTRLLEVTDATEALNYGLDKVRFLRPVAVDSEITMRGVFREVRVLDAEHVGARLYADVELHTSGDEGPAVVASTILQYTRSPSSRPNTGV